MRDRVWIGFVVACGLAACARRDVEEIVVQRGAVECTPHIRSLAVNDDHACAVIPGASLPGKAVCWGANDFGQLGNGTTLPSEMPVTAMPDFATQVVVGAHHSCARTGGPVFCWGSDAQGQLGNGTASLPEGSYSSEPVQVLNLGTATSQVVDIAGRHNLNCITHFDHFIECWGAGDTGPHLLSGPLDDVIGLPSSGPPSCAVWADLTVRCWGSNAEGQLGDGSGADTTPSAPATPSGLGTIRDLGTADFRSCAVLQNRNVKCWGDVSQGQFGFGETPVLVYGGGDAQAVSSGHGLTCVLRQDGSVRCFEGDSTPRTTIPLSGPASIIALGGHKGCAGLIGGGIECWTWSGSPAVLSAPETVPFCPPPDGGADAATEAAASDGGADAGADAAPPEEDAPAALFFDGDPCVTGAECEHGFCVDGVCCESTCGASDPNDCQACSEEAGGSADGTCSLLTGQACGAAPNICQVGGVCGAIASCPGPTSLTGCVSASVSTCSSSCGPITLTAASMGGYTVTITFPAGVMAGDIRVTPCDVDATHPPSEYQVLGGETAPACWDLYTSATYPHSSWPSPPPPPPALIVCISYPPEVVDGLEDLSVLQLGHFTSGGVSMITTDRPAGKVCGTTSSLSPFAILVPHDLTPPVLTGVPGSLVAYAPSTAGAQVTYATPTAVDAVDGPLPVSCAPVSGSTFPLGQSSVTCTAIDGVGNKGTATIPVWVQVQAPADGSFFLPPINPDGSSIFKTGSTIPVKFKLAGASAAIGDLTARLSFAKVSAGISGTEVEATSNGAANSGDLFRYDAVARQYVFNLSTKGLSGGTWSLRADLGDGVTHEIKVSLRK